MTLDEITALEYEWLKKHPDRGFMEQRDAFFRSIGVYEAWQKIFCEYVTLARMGDREALRRAVFFYWYSWAEPHELSGLPPLDEILAREALCMVEAMLGRGDDDLELRWMLPFYYSVAEFYLDTLRTNQLDEVRRASTKNRDLWQTLCLESTFENRGQLGKYWQGIQKNVAKRGPEGPPRPPPPDWHAPDEGKPLGERVLHLLRELGYLHPNGEIKDSQDQASG